MEKVKTIILLLCMVPLANLPGQTADDYTNSIIDRINSYYTAQPHDNLYIQTDRSVYFPGERILFRLVVADAANLLPSDRSNNAFLLLLDPDGEEVLSISLELSGSNTQGGILLPEKLEQGYYTLVGYVLQDELNTTHKVFKKGLVITDPGEQLMMDYRFNRERYRPGEEFRLTLAAYSNRARGIRGVNVRYEIRSGSGLLVSGEGKTTGDGTLAIAAEVPAEVQGYVLVELKAERRRTSQQMTIRVPLATDPENICSESTGRTSGQSGANAKQGDAGGSTEGPVPESALNRQTGRDIGTGVPPGGPPLPVQLKAEVIGNRLRLASGYAASGLPADTRVVIALFRKGLLYWSAPGALGQTGELFVPLTRVPSGILHVVMFEVDGGVVAEEMVFYERNDLPKLDVVLDRELYGKRQLVRATVRLEGEHLRGVSESFLSVSVVPEDMLLGDEWMIDDHMLIDADLRQDTRRLLQGVRNGEARSAMISVMLDHCERNGYPLDYLTGGVPESAIAGDQFTNSYFPEGFRAGRMMDLAAGIIDSRQPDAEMLNYKKQLENGMPVLSVIKSMKPYSMQGSKIIFSGTTNSINYQQGALIVVDNVPMGEDASVLSGISPSQVESIFISTNPSEIQKYTGLNVVGVIEITMKGYRGGSRLETTDPREKLVQDHFGEYLSGYPDYSIESDMKSVRLDHRRLLYWRPDLRLSGDRKAEFSFYTSDLEGRYVITVQGMIGSNPVAVQRELIVR